MTLAIATLAECEQVIERGFGTFVEVGSALLRIRDERLYRNEFRDFEAYCQTRWAMSRNRADRLITAADVAGRLVPIGISPANEGQARELTGLDTETAATVMTEAHQITDGKPTATVIRETRRRITEAEPDDIDAEPPPIPVENKWTDAERLLQAEMRGGKTIVVSMRGSDHARIIAWADQHGHLVRVDRKTIWGNPFVIPDDGDRHEVITKYEHYYLPHKPTLLSTVGELKGLALACWCAPAACHGDVLATMADQVGAP